MNKYTLCTAAFVIACILGCASESRIAVDEIEHDRALGAGDGAIAPPAKQPSMGMLGSPPDYVDVNSASGDALQVLHGIGPALSRRIIDGRPYDGWIDLSDSVRGIGDRTALRMVDDGAVIGPWSFDAQPISHVQTFMVGWWHDDDSEQAVSTLVALLDERYEQGARWFTLNGPHFDGAPGIDAWLPEGHWEALNKQLKPWIAERDDVRVGLYFRSPGGEPEGWQFHLYENWDVFVDPWIDIGFTIIGVDAGQRYDETRVQFNRVRADNPDLWLYTEAHGDFTFPYPTFAIPRWFWNRYWKDDEPIPDVSDSPVPRYVRMSNHTVWVDGEHVRVWDALGISRDELLHQFRERGYEIISGDLEDLDVW